MLLLGSIAYAFVMLLLYVYGFGPYEGQRVVYYDRYLGTFCMAVWITILMIYFYVNSVIQQDRWRSFASSTIALILICGVLTKIQNVFEQVKPALTYSSFSQPFQQDAEYLCANTEDKARIYMISQNSNAMENLMFQYLTSPRVYNRDGYSLGKKYSQDDIYTVDLSIDEFEHLLLDYDYLYLYSVDDQFVDTYCTALGNEHNLISDGQIYHIESNGGLEKVLTE